MATETSITRQAPYIEALGQQYGKDLTALTGKAMPTAGYAPTVAGQDPAQAAAYTQATTAGQGIGAYEPYLTQAGAYSGPMTGAQLGTIDPVTGQTITPTLAAGSFMSPYQQQVMQATMDKFDVQAQKGLTGIGSLAAQSGNLGGGREGVMRSEYQSESDMNRAMLQAQMLQQGFGQAQQGRQQAYQQQMQMAQAAPQFQGRDIATLGSAGAIQQAQTQATLDAQREANRMAAYEPYERLGYMGAGLQNVLGGMGGQYQTTVSPNQSALQQAMGILGTGIGAYKTFMD
jgi:hypothetical protein